MQICGFTICGTNLRNAHLWQYQKPRNILKKGNVSALLTDGQLDNYSFLQLYILSHVNITDLVGIMF
jgi:hypothetical protein